MLPELQPSRQRLSEHLPHPDRRRCRLLAALTFINYINGCLYLYFLADDLEMLPLHTLNHADSLNLADLLTDDPMEQQLGCHPAMWAVLDGCEMQVRAVQHVTPSWIPPQWIPPQWLVIPPG